MGAVKRDIGEALSGAAGRLPVEGLRRAVGRYRDLGQLAGGECYAHAITLAASGYRLTNQIDTSLRSWSGMPAEAGPLLAAVYLWPGVPRHLVLAKTHVNP